MTSVSQLITGKVYQSRESKTSEDMEVARASEPTIRVQSIAQNSRIVPDQYLQPQEIRPGKNIKYDNGDEPLLPLINLGDGDVEVTRVQVDLGRACRDWGAFHVVSHGIPVELLDEMRRVGRSFFEDLDMEEKLKYSCDPNFPASEGYGSRMLVASKDTVLDWRDYFDHHSLPLSRRNPERWPHFPPNYRLVGLLPLPFSPQSLVINRCCMDYGN